MYLSPLAKQKIKVRMDNMFPEQKHIRIGIKYKIYKQLGNKKPKQQGMGLMFPHRRDDKQYFQWFLKHADKGFDRKRYFKNRWLNIFTNIYYKKIRGTRDEKFRLLYKLLSEVFGLRATHENSRIRNKINVYAKVITLVGEGYFKWNEKDGFFYRATKKLSTKKETLNSVFNNYVGKLNAKEQERLGHVLAPVRKTSVRTREPVYTASANKGAKKIRKSRASFDSDYTGKTRNPYNKGQNIRKRLQRKRKTFKSQNPNYTNNFRDK